MNKKTELIAGPLLLALSLGASGEVSPLRSLAATCAACHGSQGVAPLGMPSLAGQTRAALLQKLRDFKAGTAADAGPGALMPQLARGYSDAQLAALAGYFAEPSP